MFAFLKSKPKFPTGWLDSLTENRTPDIADLVERQGHAVFITNNLMRKRSDHYILDGSQFAGDAFTTFNCAGWYRKSDGLPIMLKAQDDNQIPLWKVEETENEKGKLHRKVHIRDNAYAAIFKGELWIVPTSVLMELDKYHNNNVSFARERVDIYLPYEERLHLDDGKKIPTGMRFSRPRAWIWLGKPDFWYGPADPFAHMRKAADATSLHKLGHSTWDRSRDPNTINFFDYTPMPVFPPNKHCNSLYYYHSTKVLNGK